MIIDFGEVPILSTLTADALSALDFSLLGVALSLLGDIVGISFDPISLIADAFSGVPRDQKTYLSADWLLHAPNPAAKIFGLELYRLVRDYNIVLSTSDAGQRSLIQNAAHQFVEALAAQGVSGPRAVAALVEATSAPAQNNAPYPAALQRTLPAGYHLLGSDKLNTEFAALYSVQRAAGRPPQQAAAQALGRLFAASSFFDLLTFSFQPPPPPSTSGGLGQLTTPILQLDGREYLPPGADQDPTHFAHYTAVGNDMAGLPLIGGPLMDNLAAATAVLPTNRSAVELGPNGAGNQAANDYYMTVAVANPPAYLAQLEAFWAAYPNHPFMRVDGACPIPHPTTAEILQWACNKWGIDPRLAYGESIEESGWDQLALGDDGTSSGILQIADRNTALHPNHAFPGFDGAGANLARQSTAFNADFWASYIWTEFTGRGAFTPGGSLARAVQSWATGYNNTPGAYVTAIEGFIAGQAWLAQLFPAGLYTVGSTGGGGGGGQLPNLHNQAGLIAAPADLSTVHGTVTITITGAQTAGWANVYIDGAYFSSTPPLTWQWDTTTVTDGQHTISVSGFVTSGQPLWTYSISVLVQNHVQTQPPPPPTTPPPAAGTPPPSTPNACAAVVDCAAVTEDYVLLGQQLNAIAAQLQWYNAQWAALPRERTTDCCQQLVGALGDITAQLEALAAEAAAPTSPPTVNIDVSTIAHALAQLAVQLAQPRNELLELVNVTAQTLDPLKQIAGKIAPVDLSALVGELKRRNDDLQVPDSWKQALLESGAIPREWSGLIQSTTWETVAASGAHFLGWLLGVGLSDAIAIVDRLFMLIIKPAAGAIWRIVTDVAAGFSLGSDGSVVKIAHAGKAILGALDNVVGVIAGSSVTAIIDAYEAGIAAIDTSTDAGVDQATRVMFGRVFELAMTARLVAWLCELPYFSKNLGTEHLAETLIDIGAFDEILRAVHRPFVTAALNRPATYSYNRRFPNALPGTGEALGWWSRGYIGDTDIQHTLASHGLSSHWATNMMAAAYRPLNDRSLATLFQDAPVDHTQLNSVLRDNGYSPAHSQFLLDLFSYNTTKNVRNSYVAEAIQAYAHGVMADTELHDILESLGWSAEARKFVIDRAALQRRVTLAGQVEHQIVPLVRSGLITSEEGTQQLEAAGIQEWYADLEIALATTQARIRASAKEASAEAKAETRRIRNLSRAAVAEYQRGVIDLPALSAALIALGLDPTLVASITAVEDARHHGRLKLSFGVLLDPQAAQLLTERVAAIGKQVTDTLLGFEAARAQLSALDIPATNINALLARWAAGLKKTPGSTVLLSPVSGVAEYVPARAAPAPTRPTT